MKQRTETEIGTKSSGAEVWIEWIWTGSVALLTGFAGLYFGSMVLFRMGVPLGSWQGVFFVAPVLAVSLIRRPGREGWAIGLGCLLVTASATALAAPFHDFSWDGMGARQGMVEAIVQGSTPRASPTSHVLSAWIACLTGQINAGKAVNLLAAVAAFGSVLRFLRALRLPREWSWVGAAVAALNPVFVYQLSSYYIDGFTGSLLACLVCAYGLVYLAPEDLRRWLFLGLVLALVAPAKVSGLAYAVILGTGFLIALLVKQGWTLPKLLKLAIVLAGLVFLAFLSLLLERGDTYRWSNLISSTNLKTPNFGVGGGSSAPTEAVKMSKLEAFMRSHFAPTRTMSLTWERKFPFWFNRPELALFEDLEADARSGGFGPLYGGMLILAAAAAAAALFRQPRLPWLVWIPAITILASCLLSQAWWARWVPQGWLVPIALVVPVLTLQPWGVTGTLARISVVVGLLNSTLILAFYTSGCFQYQAILNGQIRALRLMPAPISVYVPTFPSNLSWFQNAGIRYTKLPAPPPPPRMILQGTDTQIALPEDWQNRAKDLGVLPIWEKRKLVQTKP